MEVVKRGDGLEMGNSEGRSVGETRTQRRRDSMMNYVRGDEVMWSNGGFGKDYCDEHLLNEEVEQRELCEKCQSDYGKMLNR